MYTLSYKKKNQHSLHIVLHPFFLLIIYPGYHFTSAYRQTPFQYSILGKYHSDSHTLMSILLLEDINFFFVFVESCRRFLGVRLVDQRIKTYVVSLHTSKFPSIGVYIILSFLLALYKSAYSQKPGQKNMNSNLCIFINLMDKKMMSQCNFKVNFSYFEWDYFMCPKAIYVSFCVHCLFIISFTYFPMGLLF